MILDYVKLKEIKPALSGYISDSQTLLKSSIPPDEKVVHDVRVLMKKLRAVIRLVAPQIDTDYAKKDIRDFREIGRLMSAWRDTSVHRKTIKDLRKNYPSLFLQLENNSDIVSLLRKPEPVYELTDEMKTSLEKIDDILNKAKYRIRFQSMNKVDPQVLIQEFENTYSDVADLYLRSRNSLKPKSLHEFRKRSKDFLYQLIFFRPLNPSVIKTLEKRLDVMTQNLGKYNDLTQLIRTIGYKYPGNHNDPVMDELIVKIRERQDAYLSKVWPMAYKIFCPGQKLVNILGFKLLVI